jgi:hypothetical protein
VSTLGYRRGPKLIIPTALTSELGVNLVARRVMQMGHAWHPTTAAFDAGIDGFIELRDQTTNEALNLIVQVQVKSTEGTWPNETGTTFDYVCDERDLAHWRRGNAPVVLVLTRTKTDEAYWVSIKDYFKSPAALKDRRVRFQKTRDRFDETVSTALRRLAVAPDSGLFIAPITKHETLFSNLLVVSRLPAILYSAITPFGKRHEVNLALGENSRKLSEFAYRSKRILSIYDLDQPEWQGVVEKGTVESFATSEWAQSDDDDTLTDFKELLGRCLSQRVRMLGMRHNDNREHYFFEPSSDLSERTISYTSVRQQTSRSVFKKYTSKSGFGYYRHSAFESQFRRYDGEWLLVITPTYHFTQDGYRPLLHYESKLKGIKALEKNAAVLSQVVFFAAVLTDREHDLFSSVPEYPSLGFGELKRFAIEVGVDDKLWLPNEEEEIERAQAAPDELAIASEDTLPLLFEDEIENGDIL